MKGRVVIVGASIVGLSSALALARAGADVTVLERSDLRALDIGGGLASTLNSFSRSLASPQPLRSATALIAIPPPGSFSAIGSRSALRRWMRSNYARA